MGAGTWQWSDGTLTLRIEKAWRAGELVKRDFDPIKLPISANGNVIDGKAPYQKLHWERRLD